MKDKKQQFLGILREFLTAGGALAFGAFEGTGAVVGLIVAIAAIIWALSHHEGRNILKTSIRKALSSLPGVLLALNVIGPEQAASVAGIIAPALALGWSLLDKGASKTGVTLSVWAMVGLITLLLPSCGVVKSYEVDGAGLDWQASPVQVLPASRVAPLVDVPLPREIGGGAVQIPIRPTK